MKRTLPAFAFIASFLTGSAVAQNVWNGVGVTTGTPTMGTDWTDSANYTATPVFNTTTDLKFSTITNSAGGLTLSAGTGGTYAVRDLFFGDVTATVGEGQTTAQSLTVNGNGTAGATTINLTRDIYVPSIAGSVTTLGSDLTLNLSNASHSVKFTSNVNASTLPNPLPVLVINSLITGGGTGARILASYSGYGSNSSTPVVVYANNNNSFVAVQNRFDGQVSYTSIANVGGGNSSLGNATNATTGALYLGNGATLNFIGVGDQSTDRDLYVSSGNTLGNAVSGTTVTFNGQFINSGTSGSIMRGNVASGATLVLNGSLSDGTSTVASLTKQGSTVYYTATGANATNDGLGMLVVNGNNSFSGLTFITLGTLRIGHVNALGNTVGATSVGFGATLDLNGQSIAEYISMTGTGFGSAGALINSNTATKAGTSGTVALTANASVGGAGNITLSGVVSESGGVRGLTKVGSGTLLLNATNTYTGSTTVSAGTLGGTGSIGTGPTTFATGAILNPGDGALTGQFNFGGNLTLSNDAIFSVSLNTAAGLGFDRVAVGGNATITGSILAVALGDAFSSSAVVGQTFGILTATGTLTGQFDQGTSISATASGNVYDFGISYAGKTITLTLNNITASPVPEPSTWALIVGGISLGVVVARRRFRKE